jgi:hypothetical protein
VIICYFCTLSSAKTGVPDTFTVVTEIGVLCSQSTPQPQLPKGAFGSLIPEIQILPLPLSHGLCEVGFIPNLDSCGNPFSCIRESFGNCIFREFLNLMDDRLY